MEIVLQIFSLNIISGNRAVILNIIADYFFICSIYGLLYWRHVQAWPQVSGKLVNSAVDSIGLNMRADEVTYVAKVQYQYNVDGQQYEGKRLSPIQIIASTNMRALLRWQMRYITYLDNGEVAVFYNPKKPQKSYLIKHLRIEPFLYAACFILPIVFWLRH